jgi:hypothetical protein
MSFRDPYETTRQTQPAPQRTKQPSINLSRVILDGTHHFSGLAAEVSQENQRRTGQPAQGLLLSGADIASGNVQHRSDLSAGTNNLGGYTTQTSVTPEIAEAMIPYSGLVSSKITVMDGLTSNFNMNVWQTGFSPSGFAENTTVTDLSSEALRVLQIGPPSSMRITLKMSKEWLKQTGFDAKASVKREMFRAIGSTVDLYMVNQILATPENTGTNRDLSKLAPGYSFGSAATWAKIVNAKEAILANDVRADDPSFSWILSPSSYGRWSQIPKVATFPDYLIENNRAADLPVRVTNNLTNCVVPHTALLARWSDFVLGIFGIDVVSDVFTLASTNQVKLTINLLYSAGFLRATSCIKSDDAANQ